VCYFSSTKVNNANTAVLKHPLSLSLSLSLSLIMEVLVNQQCSCKSETFSTLRFAQRAKAVKNKAVVNEEMEDDVNHLREVIRQLRVDSYFQLLIFLRHQ